jgi:hypothetical protein
MFIPDPDFYLSRIPDLGYWIPDPKTGTKERGEKKFVVIPFFVATNFTNCKLFYFWNAEEKIVGQFSKNYITFYPKNCHLALKNMGLGSGIPKKPILNPGSRSHKGTGYRIPDPQYCSHDCDNSRKTEGGTL